MPSDEIDQPSTERTPLLSNRLDEESESHVDEQNDDTASNVADSISSQSQTKKSRRWPTIIALTVLCLGALIVCIGFAAPAVVETYAKEAVVFEPEKLSIDSFTSIGVRARVQGKFYLDGERVRNNPIRHLGRAATWIAREVETRDSEVNVYLPDYGKVLLGSAIIPPIKVNIRDLHENRIDFLVELEPGDVDGVRRLAKDYLDGKINALRVEAVAKVPLKSGLIWLGTQTLSQALQLEGKRLPKIPNVAIQELKLAEYGPPGHPDGMKAQAVVSVMNDYPVNFDVPPLAFKVLLPDCFGEYLMLGTAQTGTVHILPRQFVNASVEGLIQQLPTSLTTACPGSNNSPLDKILADYLGGRDATVYIQGGQQGEDTPDWIGKLLQDMTVPFSLPGHPFENLIKNFSLSNVHFSLPDPLADDSRPTVSAIVNVLVGLPPDLNVNLDVDKVRAMADVYYHGAKMGKLDLRQWQAANATKKGDDLMVTSVVDNAPLEITDDDVFSKVVQQLIFGGNGVRLAVKAEVDVDTQTALGDFVVRNIPAEGDIFVKPLSGNFQTPKISNMEVVDTSAEAITLQASVNVTNPTDYSAHVPHVNVSLFVNETRVGYAWTSADIVPGINNIVMRASWEVGPVGRNWLSQFISGQNTSLTVKSHANSIPSIPDVGLSLTIPTPRLFGKFIKEATMHIISSTATFILVSPVSLYVTSISAAAFYNGTEVGTIDWEYPFAVDEGMTETPRLPVKWGVDAVGTIKDAIGGTLKLNAIGDVGVRIGEWQEKIHYAGSGIGAKIRL